METELDIKMNSFINSVAQRQFDPKTTKSQIMAGGRYIVGSWGAHGWQGIDNKALVFKVSGMLFTGFVVVTLGWMDTYSVHLVGIDSVKFGESIDDVYCDKLTNVIDELVETPNS